MFIEGIRWPRVRVALTLLVCAVAGVAMSPGQARAADCAVAAIQANFCKRCTTVIPASTTRDIACYGQPPTGTNAPETIMVGTSIAKQARNGRVKLEGRVWHYTPKKGFVGRDTFTIERDMLRGGELYVIYLQFEMDVKP